MANTIGEAIAIHKDKAKITKEQRADWELETLKRSELSNSELDRVEGALSYWEVMADKAEKGLLKPSEIAELNLQRRISAVTEGRTPEFQRNERAERIKRMDKASEALRPEKTGQSEAEFQAELLELNKKYNRAMQS